MSLTSYRAAPSRVIASAEPGSGGKPVLMQAGPLSVNPRARANLWQLFNKNAGPEGPALMTKA